MNKKIETQIRNIIEQTNKKWQLFDSHEPVVLSISGGKDSLSLLAILHDYLPHYQAVHIAIEPNSDLTFLPFVEPFTKLEIIETNIMGEAKSSKKNACFICSRRRNQAIFEYAHKLKIKKVIFAHNRDDVIETLLMNMLYSRKISTMLPKQPLFGGKIEVIRPLYEVPEILLSNYAKDIPVITKSCEYDGNTKREYVKSLVKQIAKNHLDININDNLYNSLLNLDLTHIPAK